MITTVKANLTGAIKAQNINVLEIDEHLEELSAVLQGKIQEGFDEYGLAVPQFYVTTIVLPENDPNFKKIRELHTISLQTKMARAEADVTAARRQIEMERQTTQTEISKREAERRIIEAQAEAQKQKLVGLTEAEIMAAKGYNQKDVLQAEVQKAYAEGIGNMSFEGGSGGGAVGDVLGLGIGMAAAQAIVPQMSEMMKGLGAGGANAEANIEDTVCDKCGKKIPLNSKFCPECGDKREILSDNEMLCPSCGKKTPKGKFCVECGAALIRKCPKCNAEIQFGGKFCSECGEKLV